MLALAGLAFAVLPAPARASWSEPGGAKVVPSGTPQLAIPDGSGGAFVVCHDEYEHVFAQHLTAAGDLAPGWPAAGAVVCSTGAFRFGCLVSTLKGLSAATDGAGGLYIAFGGTPVVTASGAPTVFVQHLGANGARVAGWPVNGLAVSTGAGQWSPLAFPDGAGGVFVIWRDERPLFPVTSTGLIMLQHFLADGTRAPGWSALGRVLNGNLPLVPFTRVAATFAADPTGGAWGIVTQASADTAAAPSGYVAVRIDGTTGAVADGWGEAGLMLPGPSADVGHPDSREPRITPDGSGGAWLWIASGARGAVIAFHPLADGGFDPALPADGLALEAAPDHIAEPDGAGGFYAAGATSYRPVLAVHHLLADGSADPAWPAPVEISAGRDPQLFPTADGVFASGWVDLDAPHCNFYAGNVVVGRLAPDGSVPQEWPVGQTMPPFDFPAALDVSMSGWESPGVACADGLGGVVVAWRVLSAYPPLVTHEVRAMRYTLHGPVAGVAPRSGAGPALRGVRFTPAGIRVWLELASPGLARLGVYDLLGRRVAGSDVAQGVSEQVVPGTSDLASGIYFLRLHSATGEARARVLVRR